MYPPEQQNIVGKLIYYNNSMYLYQQLLMNSEQRAVVTLFLACNHERRYRYESARYYYRKAQNFYQLLMSDTSVTFDLHEITSTMNKIAVRISHVTTALTARTFSFLWTV